MQQKKNPEKKFRLIQDSNILPMQLECCTSISQWFKSCDCQNYFRLSFVAPVPAKIFFAFKIILISTCSLHLWVIRNVTSSKNFGRKQIYCYCHKTSKWQWIVLRWGQQSGYTTIILIPCIFHFTLHSDMHAFFCFLSDFSYLCVNNRLVFP